MRLDHIQKVLFKTHIFLKSLYFGVFTKLTLLKSSPTHGELFNKL